MKPIRRIKIPFTDISAALRPFTYGLTKPLGLASEKDEITQHDPRTMKATYGIP